MRFSTQKKIYIYPIEDTDGTPLDILTYTNEGVLDRVDTFISCEGSSVDVMDVKERLAVISVYQA